MMQDGDGKFFKQMKFGAKYVLKCHCFWGSSLKNTATIVFNVLMMINTAIKFNINAETDQYFRETDLTKEYINFDHFLIRQDIMLYMDCIIYINIVVVFLNVTFAWLPRIFNEVLQFITEYMNKTVLMLWLISIVFLVLFSWLRTKLEGPYLYEASDLGHALHRNLMALSGGFFVESGLNVFGIDETNTSLEDFRGPAAMITQQVLFGLFYRFGFFNVFIALILNYMQKARQKSEER